MGRIIEIASGYPGLQRRGSPSPTASCPRCWSRPATRPTPSASGTSRPRTSATPGPAGPAGRSAAASSASTGSCRARRTSSSRTSSRDNHRCSPATAPEEGYHLTDGPGRPGHRLRTGPAGRRPRQAVLPLLLSPGRATRPTRLPRRGSSAIGARSTPAGTAGARRRIGTPAAAGVLPEGTELSPRPDWVPAWDSLPADAPTSLRSVHGGLRRVPHPYRSRDRAAASTSSRRTGDLDNTMLVVLSDNGASSEGGPTGSMNDVRPWNGARRPSRRRLGPHRRDRRPSLAQQLPVGMDGGRQHTVPPLEAGGARGWGRRPAASCTGPAVCGPGSGFRRQYVHAIDIVPTVLEALGIEPPEHIGGVAPEPRSRAPSFPYVDRRPRRARTARRPSTTRCSAVGPSTTTGGRPSRTTRSGRSSRASTPTTGSSTTWRSIPRSATTWPPRSRHACVR